ncbi:TPA: hypothetical protein ACKAEE_002886 [Pseudomonas aeruginosa]|uniref:hypothetical protein n=1 Tax=Pseudomonas TaxID=286 RepID=UPI0007703EA7|nr:MULTISPECIES: hypothetical protein [Pseudomonas]AMK31177.1 Protein involved in biosynthesis of mitomycin antibiotics/polyketide fumonisin [Pseudomonas putida]MDH0627581.1 hypothetical protein [Pseudomonas mosselii]MDH0677522.1 hypothetical protein [Pseudomonas mosselii]MDH0925334.1 hypothetical protein [Pseudomonas mosselii]MDH1134353.1 hypothetical protein [Pseudomonas mosselii]
MTPEQVVRINNELDAPLAALDAGSRHEQELTAEFHGHQTKQLTNLVTHSKTFREEILDDDLFHELGSVLSPRVR